MPKSMTISDLEEYFVGRADKRISPDNLLKEFANLANVKFTYLKYRFPDSFGIIVDKSTNTWINIFYNANRNTFGYQLFINGEVQSVLSSLNSDCSIVELIMRLAATVGNLSDDNDNDNSDSDNMSSSEYDD